MEVTQAGGRSVTPRMARESELGNAPTLPWHSLAAADAQTKAETRGQTWLNAPGVVEHVLDELQAITWAAWHAWWRGQISEAEARYRQHVEVRWAAAIVAGKHPGYGVLPAWHMEQLPTYLCQVYYHQDQGAEWEDVPDQAEVVEALLWTCSEAANLRFQGIPAPDAPMPADWLARQLVEMAEDVAMHAAYLRGLVEDRGLEDE